MADKLTAAELAAYKGPVPDIVIRRTAELDNDYVTNEDISSRIVKWGKIPMSAYNKSLQDRGKIEISTVTLLADNSDDYFTYGNSNGPFVSGLNDIKNTVLTVKLYEESFARTQIEFVGLLREPTYEQDRLVELVADHAVIVTKEKVWKRTDGPGGRIGTVTT